MELHHAADHAAIDQLNSEIRALAQYAARHAALIDAANEDLRRIAREEPDAMWESANDPAPLLALAERKRRAELIVGTAPTFAALRTAKDEKLNSRLKHHRERITYRDWLAEFTRDADPFTVREANHQESLRQAVRLLGHDDPVVVDALPKLVALNPSLRV